jgi:hypothetical protein
MRPWGLSVMLHRLMTTMGQSLGCPGQPAGIRTAASRLQATWPRRLDGTSRVGHTRVDVALSNALITDDRGTGPCEKLRIMSAQRGTPAPS